MVRFSKVMHQQREVHPTIVLTLEGIVDQVKYLNLGPHMIVGLRWLNCPFFQNQ